ncbi:CBS domain-containing protein [candidate division GN15 bacterium]|nr:CBS domain-containing protein [candidate division GN15 bacterium]
MATKRAGDIMIPLDQYPHIPYWFTLRQAIAEIEMSTLDRAGRKSLPRALLVFDEKYELVGVLRRRDILGGLEPRFLRKKSADGQKAWWDIDLDPNLVDLSDGASTDDMQRRAATPVEEFMQPIGDTVDVSDPLAKVVYKMLNTDVALLPVLDDQKVVGVVRSVDVFHEVAGSLL